MTTKPATPAHEDKYAVLGRAASHAQIVIVTDPEQPCLVDLQAVANLILAADAVGYRLPGRRGCRECAGIIIRLHPDQITQLRREHEIAISRVAIITKAVAQPSTPQTDPYPVAVVRRVMTTLLNLRF